jgi:ring-1,2-phenylacetyl-CoA epoxidase subunit PaaB
MNDTQWPRYQVFLQEREGAPFQDVGSVHATDPELALLNARDVFVRRPECTRLWVVPVKEIYSQTFEQLQREKPAEMGTGEKFDDYAIFCKLKAAGTHVMQCQVSATTPAQALRRAIGQFAGLSKASSWMIFPIRQVIASDPVDDASLFQPAFNKPFRMSTDFQTVTAMRVIKLSEMQIKSGSDESGIDGS